MPDPELLLRTQLAIVDVLGLLDCAGHVPGATAWRRRYAPVIRAAAERHKMTHLLENADA